MNLGLRKIVSTVLCIAFTSYPVIVNAQTAVAPSPSSAQTASFWLPATQTTPSLGASFAASNGVFSGTLAEGSEQMTFTMSHGVVTFDDGYSISTRILENTKNSTVMQTVTSSPNGDSSVTTVHYDRVNNEVTQSGFDRSSALLSHSRDFQLATDVFSKMHLVPATPSDGQVLQFGLLGCVGAEIAFVGAAVLTFAACTAPEPLEPIACVGSLIVLIGAGILAVDACDY